MNSFLFCLIHSPLVGPFTWVPVRRELALRGMDAVVPRLAHDGDSELPYWRQHTQSVAEALEDVAPDQPLVLVAHSGAGPLLAALGQATGRRVAAYIFVDAGIPKDGRSRLDLFESREAADDFQRAAVDGLLPTWTDDDLRRVIADDEVRRRFVSELQPLPLAVYEEPLPVFGGWPDAPCGYLRFGSNAAYDTAYKQAGEEGWERMRLDGGHFLMLVAPDVVAEALVRLVGRLERDI